MADDDDVSIGELFAERRAKQQAKRADNRASSTGALRSRGIYFTSHNQGAHLIVMERWDFYPGTGKFKERRSRPGKPTREGRGLRSLLSILDEDHRASEACPSQLARFSDEATGDFFRPPA